MLYHKLSGYFVFPRPSPYANYNVYVIANKQTNKQACLLLINLPDQSHHKNKDQRSEIQAKTMLPSQSIIYIYNFQHRLRSTCVCLHHFADFLWLSVLSTLSRRLEICPFSSVSYPIAKPTTAYWFKARPSLVLNTSVITTKYVDSSQELVLGIYHLSIEFDAAQEHVD